MANQELTIKVRVEGNESIGQLEAQAKKLKKAWKEAEPHSAPWKQHQADLIATRQKIQSFNAALGTTHTRYFKLGEQLRSLQMATVKVMAAVYLLRKAWDMSKESAQYAQSLEALNGMVAEFGITATDALDSVRKASRGLIDDKTLVEVTNRAISLGIPFEKIGILMGIAQAKARDMGISVTQAFGDIVTGIGRGSPLIIDNLGIVLKVGEANEVMAKSLGKTVAQLTAKEKQMALLNDVVRAGTEATTRHNLAEATQLEQMQKIEAQLKNAQIFFGNLLLRVQTAIMGIYHSIYAFIASSITLMLAPFALIEKGLNKLGISSSKTFQYMVADGAKQTIDALSKMKAQFDVTFMSEDALTKATSVLNTSLGTTADKAKEATDAMSKMAAEAWYLAQAQGMTIYEPGRPKRPGAAPLPKSLETEPGTIGLKNAEKEVKSFTEQMAAGFANATGVLAQGFVKAFGLGESLLGQFLAAFLGSLATTGLNFLTGGLFGLIGLQHGGIIPEPVVGMGRSGRVYAFGESGPEYVTPTASNAIAFGSLQKQMGQMSDAIMAHEWRLKGADLVLATDRANKILRDRRM